MSSHLEVKNLHVHNHRKIVKELTPSGGMNYFWIVGLTVKFYVFFCLSVFLIFTII